MLSKRVLEEVIKKAKANKNSWTARFWEIFAYTQPNRNYIYRSAGSETMMKQIPLFTSVGKIGTDIFVNRIQTSLAPIGKDFIAFNAKDEVDQQIKNELDPLCEELSRRVNDKKNTTELDRVLNDAFYDLVAGSAIIFRQDTINGTRYEKCRLDSIFLGTEREQSVVRDYKIPACELGVIFPELYGRTSINGVILTDENKSKELNLEDVLFYNEETRAYEYYLRVNGGTVLTRKYKRSPYYIMHWSRSSDMPFGDGVGNKALPNLKRINSYIKCNLELIPFAFPMFIAQEGSIFSNDLQYKPGGIITTRGNPNQVVPINIQTQASAFKMEIQSEEMQVKQIMLDYTLPNDPREMTAAEVYARTSATDEQIYGNVSLLTDVIKKIAVDIAEDIYNLEILPVLGIGFDEFMKFVDVNIINQTSQDQQLINRINAYIQNVAFDPTAIWQGLKRSETLEQLTQAYNIPSFLRNTSAEIDQLVQMQQEAQNAQLQTDIGAQMAIDDNKEKAVAERERGEM